MKGIFSSSAVNRRLLLSTLAMFPTLSKLRLPAFAQGQTATPADPLPSWNDGAAKQAILDFVHATTDRGSPSYVAAEDRIATFDQDGTLWVEHPLYQGTAEHGVGRLAPGVHPTRPPQCQPHAGHVADQLRAKWPKLGAFIDESEADVLAHTDFPVQHRTKIHSTNPLERLNKEVKRRADVVGIFPNEGAIVRLIGAVLLEANDEWQLQHRYMQTEAMAELTPPLIEAVATHISTVAA